MTNVATELITITAYRQTETWESRDEAIEFYEEAMLGCDGAEADRYANIYGLLLDGETAIDSDNGLQIYSASDFTEDYDF